MSPLVAAFLRSTLLPSVLAAIAIYFLGTLPESRRAGLQSFVLALMFGLGNYLLLDRFSFPPMDAAEALSVAVFLLPLFIWIAPQGVGSRYLMRAVFVGLMGLVVLWHLRAQLFESSVNQRNLLAFFCLGVGLWSVLERAKNQVSALSLILLPLISFSGLSILLLLSGSASFSQLATIVCGLLGMSLTLAWLFPNRILSEAVVPLASVFLVAFMVIGHFYLDMNPWRLIFMSWPFALLWGRGFLPEIKNPILEAASLSVLAAGPVIYIVWVAFQASGPLY